MKFNREKSKEFSSISINEKITAAKYEKVILTSIGIVLLIYGGIHSKGKITSINVENIDSKAVVSQYDIDRYQYLEKVSHLKETFENDTILDYYNEGKLILNYNGNKIEVNLKALYLRYEIVDDKKIIFLSNVLNGRNVDIFTNENKSYAEDYHIIEFRKTTIFEQLYNEYLNPIIDNTIELDEESTLNLITKIESWDGRVNNLVPETIAIQNKQIWDVVSNGKKK